MKNLTGRRVWHVYDPYASNEPEEYTVFGYNPDLGGHYIRRQNLPRGRYRSFELAFPMGNPEL